jgi:hypothetical protein
MYLITDIRFRNIILLWIAQYLQTLEFKIFIGEYSPALESRIL